jgi:hypothetical protein
MKRLQLLSLLLALLATPAMGQIFLPSDPIGTKAVYRKTVDEKVSEETTVLGRVQGNRFQTDEGSDDFWIHYSPDQFSISLKELRRMVKDSMGDVPKGLAKVSITSDSGDDVRLLPLRGTVGTTYPEQDMKIKVRAIGIVKVDIDMRITEDKILRTEVRKTPFGKKELLVRKYTLAVKTYTRALGQHERENNYEEYTQWILPGRGLIREEKRDEDGDLTVRELVDFQTP